MKEKTTEKGFFTINKSTEKNIQIMATTYLKYERNRCQMLEWRVYGSSVNLIVQHSTFCKTVAIFMQK